jgi:hypothetical protein
MLPGLPHKGYQEKAVAIGYEAKVAQHDNGSDEAPAKAK